MNLEYLKEIVIIYIDGALFQSYKLYEGGAKNPLKGTSLKFLACARNASFVCIQGVKRLGYYVMAYIRFPGFAEA